MIDMATSARRDLHVPMTTILKVIGSGFGLWAVWLLWPEFLLFVIAILLAVTLDPAVAWMERRGIARGVSVLAIAGSALALLALFVVFLLPPLTAQMTHLFQDVPAFRARQAWSWVARGVGGYEAMTNVTAALRERLAGEVPFSTLTLADEAVSRDGTHKALFHTADLRPDRIAEADMDHDGRVNRAELAKAPIPLFERADTDNDGVVTRAERETLRGR